NRNLRGDLLGEYIAVRDRIELPFDRAYIKWDQLAEIMRFRDKRKPLYLIGLTDYMQDTRERIWKVDFAEDFPVESLADGRQDYYRITIPFEEAALT
ncbi:MAG: hypothetical protein IIC03_05030, partial [Proteobacteria bacterium]|nr:hypothetical protein [Pseudomonadota bacterium]